MNFNYFRNENICSLNQQRIFDNLSQAIKFKTISYADQSMMDFNEFVKLHQFLKETYLNIFKIATVEVVNKGSIIIHIKTESQLKPILFMAHLDVVSIVEGTENDWDYAPFSGKITDEYIYGRGSEDIKCMVLGELEAMEYLLSTGYKPKRDIYFCYGHDEETLGGQGQFKIMETLKQRGIQLEFVLDEGGQISQGKPYGVNKTLALINIMEKGYADISVKANSKGGHSSKPGKHTSLGLVAKAITALETNQFKPSLNPVMTQFLMAISPFIKDEKIQSYAKDPKQYEKELIDYCYNNDNLEPFVHTTTAATIIKGSSQSANVLPQTVEAVVNFRLNDTDTLEDVVSHCQKVINDEKIEIALLRGVNASSISKIDFYGFNNLKKVIELFYSDVIVVPSLVAGGTDCRFYNDICDCCYRFSPFFNDFEKCHNEHSTNERIQKRAYIHGIQFFIELIKISC